VVAYESRPSLNLTEAAWKYTNKLRTIITGKARCDGEAQI